MTSGRVGHASTTARKSGPFWMENGKQDGKTVETGSVSRCGIRISEIAAPVLKTGVGATRPGVRIPPSPPFSEHSSQPNAATHVAKSTEICPSD